MRYENGRATAEMRNRFKSGDTLTVLSPDDANGKSFVMGNIAHEPDGEITDDAKLVQHVYSFDCPIALSEGDLLIK